jgi:RNA 3'-terminal phosphate cyclase-like protein
MVQHFSGHQFFRQRLLMATLSGAKIVISEIRPHSDKLTGLVDYEASFLRLLDKITNGSIIEINYTGTALYSFLTIALTLPEL